MFLVVVARARILAALIAIAAAAAPAAAGAQPAPTTTQIHTAIAVAEHSKALWATVNICDTKQHPDTIGVRGQMPSLGFPADLSMNVQINYWSFATSKFVPDRGVSKTVSLGRPMNQVIQGGANFKFTPPVVLSGTVTFEWKLAGKVIGQATRQTGYHYKHVDGGDPPGYSRPTCEMH
jgi:hypothetical protein